MQRQVEIIVDLGARSLREHVGGNGIGQAERQQRLVHHVRAEVAQDAAAGPRLLAPAALDLGSEAVPVRFEQHHLAELRQQPLHRDEIAVPPTVVEDCERAPTLLRECNELVRLGDRNRERFIDDDVLARLERRGGNLEVRRVGGCDDHQVRLL